MVLKYDAEFYQAFEPMVAVLAARPKPAVHDIAARRKLFQASTAQLVNAITASPDVEQTGHTVQAPNGYQLSVYSFVKKGGPAPVPSSAILHCHGGGMILGSVQTFARRIAYQVSQTGVPVFSVDYRLAPEVTDTTPVEDCYAGLIWLRQNASKFNIDPARIAVMGESAGGGIVAGAALRARDEKLSPPLAKQILIYPMIDDRNIAPLGDFEKLAFWKHTDNLTGWTALLGEKTGKDDADVSSYAAPARAESLAGLPPTYIDVGGLDIFRDESIEYAVRLIAEDIEVELHVYPGLPHGFELYALQTSVVKKIFENRFKAVTTF